VLVGRDDERERSALAALLDRALPHLVEVLHELLAVGARGIQQPFDGTQVVVDDVAERPPAAGPGVWKVDLRTVLGQSLESGPQFRGRHVERRRDVDARHLRQQAHGVVAERRGVLEAWPVVVVLRGRDDAGAPVALHLERHRAAEQRRRSPDQRVVVRVDRVGVRRNEEPRAVLLHLVHREEDLRMPVAVEEPREVPVLREVHHEGIAVDVMAGVLVIEPRHEPALVGRALRPVVPVGHDALAVRVERRDQDEHHVLEHGERCRVGGGGERVEQLAGGLRRTDLRRVDARADRDDHLLGGGEPQRLVAIELARIGEAHVGCADLVEVAQVHRRADHRGDRPVSLGGGSEVDQGDTVRLRVDEREVALDRVRCRQVPIAAEPEPEVRVRRGHLRSRRRGECQHRAQHQG
jgi:hypothetical protein